MIERVAFDGAVIELEDGLTVFVGANGSGKSEALRVVADAARNTVQHPPAPVVSANNPPLIPWSLIPDSIGDDLMFIFPHIRGVERVRRVEGLGWDLILVDGDGGLAPIHDGSAVRLALGALACAYSRRVCLLDGPEVGLHPAAVQRLMIRLSAIIAARKAQAVIATHSPDLLDACPWGSVRVFARGPHGLCVSRLDEHPEADRWARMIFPGEFWGTVGEDWPINAPEGAQSEGSTWR